MNQLTMQHKEHNALYTKLNKRLNQIATKIKTETKSISCSIYLFNRNKDKLYLRGTSEPDTKKLNEDWYKCNEGLTGHISSNHALLNLKEAKKFEPIYEGKHRQHDGPFLGVPIMVKEVLCLGAMKLIRKELTGMYSDEEVRLVKKYSKDIAEDVKDIYKEARSSAIYENYNVLTNNKSIFLGTFHKMLFEQSTLENLYDYALPQLAVTVGCRAASIFKFNKKGKLELQEQIWYSRSKNEKDNNQATSSINKKIPEAYDIGDTLLLTRCVSADENRGRTLYSNAIRTDVNFEANANVKEKVALFKKAIHNHLQLDEEIKHVLTIPLKSTNRAYGVIRLMNKITIENSLDSEGFDPNDIEWAETLSNIISNNILRIKNTSKYDIIRELNKVIRDNENIRTQYNTICNQITDSTTSYSCCIIRQSNQRGALEIRGINEGYGKPSKGLKNKGEKLIEVHEILHRTIFSKKEIEVIALEKYTGNRTLNENWVEKYGFKSVVHVPIKAKTEKKVPYGVLSLYTQYEFDFSKKHIKNLEELAEQISHLMAKEEYNSKQKAINEFQKTLEIEVNNYIPKLENTKPEDVEDFHKTTLSMLMQIGILEIQKITDIDQCVIVRKSKKQWEYEIIMSLDRKQKGRFLNLPDKLPSEVVKNGSYRFESEKFKNDSIMKNTYLKKVKEILFFEIDTTLNHYLGIKNEQSEYYLAFILLKNLGIKERSRRESRQKLTDLEMDYKNAYARLTLDLSKALRNINRTHDSRFVTQIVDTILYYTDNLTDTHQFLLNEIKFRHRKIVDVFLFFKEKGTSKLIFLKDNSLKLTQVQKKELTANVEDILRKGSSDTGTGREHELTSYFEQRYGNIGTLLLIPLNNTEIDKGFIGIHSDIKKAFTLKNKHFFSSVANQMAVGIKYFLGSEINKHEVDKPQQAYIKTASSGIAEFWSKKGIILKNEYSQRRFKGFVGDNILIQMAKFYISKHANGRRTIFITGESGTGKEVVAEHINRLYKKSAKLELIDMGTIDNQELFASTIFGHTKGAFTGATYEKEGKFQQLKSGTLFLDEIGNLSLENQKKILQVLQKRIFQKVGGNKDIRLSENVRFVLATNMPLERLKDEKIFRQDLLARLAQVHIHLPPLRERKEDIKKLCDFLLRNYEDFKPYFFRLDSKALKILKNRFWEGNVREMDIILWNAAWVSKEITRSLDVKNEIVIGADEVEYAINTSVYQSESKAREVNPAAGYRLDDITKSEKYKMKTLTKKIEFALGELEKNQKPKSVGNVHKIMGINRNKFAKTLREVEGGTSRGYLILYSVLKDYETMFPNLWKFVRANAKDKNWLNEVYDLHKIYNEI